MTKSPNAFRTISEAADEVGVPQHVLRFWETKFGFITPLKRAGGRRFYRPQDIVVLKGVRRLLHDEGVTLRGVDKMYKAKGLVGLLGEPGFPTPTTHCFDGAVPAPVLSVARPGLAEVLVRLEGVQGRLNRALAG